MFIKCLLCSQCCSRPRGAHKTPEHQSNTLKVYYAWKYYGRCKVKEAAIPSSRSLLSTEAHQCSRKWVTGKMGSKRGGHLSSRWVGKRAVPVGINSAGLAWMAGLSTLQEGKQHSGKLLSSGFAAGHRKASSKVSRGLQMIRITWGGLTTQVCEGPSWAAGSEFFGVWALGLDFLFPQETQAWLGWKPLASGALVAGPNWKGKPVKSSK